jgi:hypothetical protein
MPFPPARPTLRLARYSIAAVVVLLAFALLADLSATFAGRLTADAYYLPLRSVPVGDRRGEIEDILIATHGRLLWHQRRIWLAIHGSALVCAMLALDGVAKRPAG